MQERYDLLSCDNPMHFSFVKFISNELKVFKIFLYKITKIILNVNGTEDATKAAPKSTNQR